MLRHFHQSDNRVGSGFGYVSAHSAGGGSCGHSFRNPGKLDGKEYRPTAQLAGVELQVTAIFLLPHLAISMIQGSQDGLTQLMADSLDLDHPLENDAYEELAPFLRRIQQQHGQISAQLRKLRAMLMGYVCGKFPAAALGGRLFRHIKGQ